MLDRQYDIVILGATGFTGQFVVEEVGRISHKDENLKFAIAGRNKEKLEATLVTARNNCNLELNDVGVIVADVNDAESLLNMAKQGKVVINCVGPYRFYGEKVVKACIEAGANHVDISGEPQYLEQMQLLYSKAAEENGLHVVGACGFDSIPAEMGTVFLQDNFPGDVNAVEMVVGFHDSSQGSSSINVTTMECAVHGFSNRHELKKIRKALFTEKLPKPSYRLPTRRMISWSETAKRWCVPNLASDRSVVMRTQRLNYEIHQKRPLQFGAYFGMQSFFTALGTIIFGMVFAAMSSMYITKKIFLKFPEFFTFGAFTRSGPRREELEGLKFCVTLTGTGWDNKLDSADMQHDTSPNVTKTVQVIGSDPGYYGTATIVTQCALTILQEKNKLPKKGGVFTPGSAFLQTSLISRLQNRGISFDIV